MCVTLSASIGVRPNYAVFMMKPSTLRVTHRTAAGDRRHPRLDFCLFFAHDLRSFEGKSIGEKILRLTQDVVVYLKTRHKIRRFLWITGALVGKPLHSREALIVSY